MGTQIVLFSPLHLSQLGPDGDVEDTRVSHGLGGDCHIQKIVFVCVCVCFQNVNLGTDLNLVKDMFSFWELQFNTLSQFS